MSKPYLAVTCRFAFEMAHLMPFYEGGCKNIHGHSYHLEVSITGEPCKEKGVSNEDMVIDFQLVHNIIKKEIIEKFDHALTLNKNNVELIELAEKQKLKIYALDYHPTVENLVSLFAKLIQEKLPKENKLLKVQLRESDSNSVEWYSG